MGFMVVLAVLLVTLGRVGDIFGRVKMYNLGFAVFTVFSILLSITWMHGPGAAVWLIGMRVGQGWAGPCSSPTPRPSSPTPSRQPARARSRDQQRRRHRRCLHRSGARRTAGPVQWHMVFLVSVPSGSSERCGPTASSKTGACARRPTSTGGATHLRRRSHPDSHRHHLWPSPLWPPHHGLVQSHGAGRDLRRSRPARRVLGHRNARRHPMFRLTLFRIRAFTPATWPAPWPRSAVVASCSC